MILIFADFDHKGIFFTDGPEIRLSENFGCRKSSPERTPNFFLKRLRYLGLKFGVGPGGPGGPVYTYPLRDVAILRSVPRGRGCSIGPEIRLSRPALGGRRAY